MENINAPQPQPQVAANWTPIPDPTLLTSTLVDKAKDDIRRDIEFVRQILTQRLDAMDTATLLLQEWRETLPRRLDESLTALTNVTQERFLRVEEKFKGVDLQFAERDVRVEQSSTSTKVAIDAALQAQKEMVASQNTNIAQALARIEATAQKQIEQLVTLLQTTTGATDGKINDIKDRVALIEGRSAGIGSSWGVVVAVIGFAIAAIGVTVAFLKG